MVNHGQNRSLATMWKVIYKISNGTRMMVLVGAETSAAAICLVRDSDSAYTELVECTNEAGEVWMIREDC